LRSRIDRARRARYDEGLSRSRRPNQQRGAAVEARQLALQYFPGAFTLGRLSHWWEQNL